MNNSLADQGRVYYGPTQTVQEPFAQGLAKEAPPKLLPLDGINNTIIDITIFRELQRWASPKRVLRPSLEAK